MYMSSKHVYMYRSVSEKNNKKNPPNHEKASVRTLIFPKGLMHKIWCACKYFEVIEASKAGSPPKKKNQSSDSCNLQTNI